MGQPLEVDQSVVVLTGGSSGIGLAAAKLLARRARLLVVHGVGPVPPELPDAAVYLDADFRRFTAVTELAERIAEVTDRVDVLINNAGIPGPPRRSETPDGHEVTFQVNVLAGALLTERL